MLLNSDYLTVGSANDRASNTEIINIVRGVFSPAKRLLLGKNLTIDLQPVYQFTHSFFLTFLTCC